MDTSIIQKKLILANKELAFLHQEKAKRSAELMIANKELTFQNQEKGERASELILVNQEFIYQSQEKEKRAAELIIANKELAFQNEQKEKQAVKLIIVNMELAFQNLEKEKRAAELFIANKELAFQNEEKEKRAAELIVANKELIFQNLEKEKRAAELLIANKELAYQNEEKEKRAAELIIANKELSFQNKEKEKRAAELIVTNTDLKKAKEKFRLVVESSHNAMVLVNSEGIITLINKQTEALFGYKRNELVNHKLEMIIPERFRKHYSDNRHEFLTRSLAHDMGAGREVFVLAKENREIQVEVVINPIETADGHKVLLTIIDVTELKFHEAMLKKQNQELEQFAYIASHDLQEPLRTISNYMMLFEEEYSDILDDNAIKYLHSVNNTSMRMGAMIKSLLDFSRLNNIKKLTTVDLNNLVGDVLADLDTTIKTSDAVIKVSELPSLNIYECEVRQLFQNLISNSIKFHKKDVSPEISISSKKINERWEFAVTDNGIGIAPDYFERVFEIFKCLHTDEKYSGSGIGLAKCRKIVQLHKGEIWIKSTPGQGTTIHFTIPILTI